jgi:hypothetical protein
MAYLLCGKAKRGKGESPLSPSLQEMGKSLESGNISEMTRPSLQYLFWQELDSNFLVSHKKSPLTRPSLQDFEYDVFCPALFAEAGYVSHIPDFAPYSFANNPGSLPSSTAGRLCGRLYSLDHFLSYDVANVFSEHADIPSFYSIADF